MFARCIRGQCPAFAVFELSFGNSGKPFHGTPWAHSPSVENNARPVTPNRKTFMKNEENNLQELLVEELRDIYNAEGQLLKALPKMAKAAQSERLKEAFERHLEETEQQVERLERAFESLGETAKGKKCQAMEGLIEEAKEIIDEHKESAMLDAALICAAQKVE